MKERKNIHSALTMQKLYFLFRLGNKRPYIILHHLSQNFESEQIVRFRLLYSKSKLGVQDIRSNCPRFKMRALPFFTILRFLRRAS